MKITGFRQVMTIRDWGRPIGDINGVVASGVTAASAVIVETDSGIEGTGLGQPAQLDVLFRAIEGQDPRGVSALYDAMLAQVFKQGHQGATFGGIGAFDMALWDIKAKAAGEPLWRLLGARDKWVPGYASGLDFGLDDEALHVHYAAAAERGFQAGKLKGGRSTIDDIRRLHIVEECLRANTNKPALMLDANEAWSLKEAVRHVHAVEEAVDLWWIEEPLRRWDALGHARLSSAVRAAVATGENLTGIEQFTPLFNAGGVDVVQTGAAWGITHFLRLAYAAHSRDLPISPVGLTAMPAVGHAAAAVPNHLSAEIQAFHHPVGIEVDEHYVDGGVVLGDEPGVGVTVDEEMIARRRVERVDFSAIDPAAPHVRDVHMGSRLTQPSERSFSQVSASISDPDARTSVET